MKKITVFFLICTTISAQSDLELYRKKIYKNPKNFDHHRRLIDHAAKTDRLQIPLKIYEDAFAKQPENPIVLYPLGYALLLDQRENRAIEILQKCVEIDPKIWQAHSAIARHFQDQNDFANALKNYEKAVKQNPKSAQLHFDLGRVHRKLEDLESAEKSFRRSSQLDKNFANPHYQLGQIDALRNEPEKAIAHYRDGAKIDPKNAKVRYQLANIFLDHDDGRNAVLAIRSAFATDPNHKKFADRLQNVSSIQAATILSEIKTDRADLELIVGKMFAKMDQPKKAIKHLENAKAIDPKNSEIRFLLGKLYEIEKPEVAIEEFKQSADLGNTQIDLLLKLVETYRKERNDPEFLKIADQILAIDKNLAEINYQLSEFYDRRAYRSRQKNDTENAEKFEKKALEHAQIAVRNSPNVAKYNLKVADFYDRNGELKAMRFYEKAISLDPQNPKPYYHRGLFMLNYTFGSAKVLLYDQEDVINDLEKAIQLDPKSAGAHRAMAIAADRLGDSKKATIHFKKTVELDQNDPTANLYLAERYANSGQSQLAITAFSRAIKSNPDDVEALKDYAFLCLDHDQERLWKEAKKALKMAIDLRPNDAEILTNYGYTLYLEGKLEEAVDQFQKSIELREDWHITHYNLGLALDRLSKNDEAISAFERVLDLRPESRQAKKAIEMIKKLKERK